MTLIPLSDLKGHLMPPATVSRTDQDAQLLLIALGVTRKFERYCNRLFAWMEEDVFSAPANVMSVSLPRYPFTGSPAVQFIPQGGGTPSDISSSIAATDASSGLVHFGVSVSGRADDRIWITYSGGYYIATGEEGDTQPEGSEALPDDLKLAFVEQVRAVCQAQGLFQLKAMGSEKDDNRVIAREIAFLPDVVEILNSYRRYA